MPADVEQESVELPEQGESCLNCDAPLAGQYCGNCGQRAQSRLISLWELTRDAFGDLFELDSRLWRTLIPLTIRPGQLTLDYLQGRRARFMPPFRTYLVLSIVFFLVAFFDPREELSIFFAPEPVSESLPAQPADTVPEELADEVIDDAQDVDEDDDDGINIRINGDDQCDTSDMDEMPPWLARRLTPERVQVMCERIVADDGQAFIGKLLDNVPVGLFVLLPVMALVLKMLYPLSRRFYVEHLLFVVHYHAFLFLILSLQIVILRLISATGFAEALYVLPIVVVTLYVPVYLFKAQRRVYGQGRILTLLKFIVLVTAYFFGLSGILAVAAIFAAFSV